jgi:simple sugar transport system substrate-binding protein
MPSQVHEAPGFASAVFAVLLCFCLAACQRPASGDGNPGGASNHRTNIYFVTISNGNRFWGLVERGARDAARQLDLEVIWTQGQEVSIEETVDRMNTAIAAKPDYMVVSDINPQAMNPVIERAKKAGIQVIDINAEAPVGARPYMFYVGASEYQSGQAAARATLDAPRPTPKRAGCLIQIQGHVGLEARCRGYAEVLGRANVIVDKVDISGGPTDAEEKARAYFVSHPDAGAIYALSAEPEVFDPVLKVVESGKLSQQVIFVASDTSQDAFQAIESGHLIAAIDQQPYLQGYLPVVWASLHSKYAYLPADDVYTGPVMVTRQNVARIEDLVRANYR